MHSEQPQVNTSDAVRIPRTRVAIDGPRSAQRPIEPHRALPSPLTRTSRARARHAGNRVYLKHALEHPCHLVLLAGATVIGVAVWSLLVLLVFLGLELLCLGVVLHLRAFRRYVDTRLEQVERARAAELRAAMLLRMSEEHRRELLRLEAVVDRIRDVTRKQGLPTQSAADDCSCLLASYVRVAIAYAVSRECLASVDRQHLEDMRHALEASRYPPASRARAVAQRRLLVARSRADRWDQTRETLEAMDHQLALIGELVQLTHERVSAPRDPGDATREIDQVVEELHDSQSTLDELEEMLGAPEPIEPEVLEMGRAASG